LPVMPDELKTYFEAPPAETAETKEGK
jgi:hypothetical protein